MKTTNMPKTLNSLFLFMLIACVISFLSVSSTFAQTTANFTYNETYGGLTQYHTPDSAQVNITRNGFGRHPVKMVYDNTKNSITTTYNFQDNAAGRRVVQERATSAGTVTSHFLFGGGLRPKVEFRKDESGNTTAHYTVYGPGGRVVSYITTDSNGDPTRLTPIHDRLGSTRALIDSSSGGSGKVEARFGYNTLGKPTETDGCTDDRCDQYREYPYRFQGHRYLPFEDETASAGYTVGVTDNVDRLYSHDHGMRFMHTDIAGQSISTYTAYGNDPVNMVDLNGFEWFKFTREQFKHGLRVATAANIEATFFSPINGLRTGIEALAIIPAAIARGTIKVFRHPNQALYGTKDKKGFLSRMHRVAHDEYDIMIDVNTKRSGRSLGVMDNILMLTIAKLNYKRYYNINSESGMEALQEYLTRNENRMKRILIAGHGIDGQSDAVDEALTKLQNLDNWKGESIIYCVCNLGEMKTKNRTVENYEFGVDIMTDAKAWPIPFFKGIYSKSPFTTNYDREISQNTANKKNLDKSRYDNKGIPSTGKNDGTKNFYQSVPTDEKTYEARFSQPSPTHELTPAPLIKD
ncbi:MAG: hypothetical protein GY938_22920 [Ketobacter sp.]|nr:hypothetical protein [Ketobacter sp.]